MNEHRRAKRRKLGHTVEVFDTMTERAIGTIASDTPPAASSSSGSPAGSATPRRPRGPTSTLNNRDAR